MNTYTLEAVEKVIAQAENSGGTVHVIHEGTLLDDYIISIPGKRHIVARAKFLNGWSSAYTVRQYRKLPAKYQALI